MLNHIITLLVVIFLVLGGADYLLGNRFGLGAEFEKGIEAAGRLLLCMTGFLVLAPVIAALLSPLVVPFFRSFGVDPSLFSGIVFANDTGGFPLAMELADDAAMGRYSGVIVGSMLGSTIMFHIPFCIAYSKPEQQAATVYGLLAGIITIPFGCLAGGFVAGFPTDALLRNTLPIALISAVLALMLLFFRRLIVRILTLFGKLILFLSVVGLVIAAVQRLSGITIIPALGSLDEVFSIVGNICIFLAGIFPLIHMVERLFGTGLRRTADRIGINQPALSGLLLCLANGVPVWELLKDMDDRGRMLNTAALVSGSCIIGDHLAYTTQIAPDLCSALLAGKFVGMTLALLLAAFLAPRLLKTSAAK